MRIVLVLLLLGLAGLTANGQPATPKTLQGVVGDATTRQPLPQATVWLRSAADSSLTTVQLTDAKGRFAIQISNHGTYQLTIRYVGYQPLSRSVLVSGTSTTIQLDTLTLTPQPVQLQEVIVQRRPPVTIRHDTLDFDASAFSTRPNAVVEELLGQLPGVILTTDGTIEAQGRTVQQVFVDGKPFFGNDPKLATRNLPAYLIANIQIYDKRSDQSAFSGVDDGSRTRIINIVTKPEGRRGQFGQQVGGYGTGGHYQAGGSFNRFSQQRQVSVLGQTNNINQAGYSLPTYSSRSAAGNGGSATSGQPGGITRSTGAGLNYSDHWGKRVDLSANYLFSQATTQSEQSTRRQTVLPTIRAQLGADSSQSGLTSNIATGTTVRLVSHRLNALLTYRPDSVNTIRISPGFSVYTTDNTTSATTGTLTGAQQPVNESRTNNTSTGTNTSFNNSLLWLYRFRRAGQTLSLNLNTAVSGLTNTGINRARNQYYIRLAGQDSLPATNLNQRNTQRTQATTNELTLVYTEPLGSRQAIEFRYALFTSHNTAERRVSDSLNTGSGTTYQPNAGLSNQYQSRFITHQLGLTGRCASPDTRVRWVSVFSGRCCNRRISQAAVPSTGSMLICCRRLRFSRN